MKAWGHEVTIFTIQHVAVEQNEGCNKNGSSKWRSQHSTAYSFVRYLQGHRLVNICGQMPHPRWNIFFCPTQNAPLRSDCRRLPFVFFSARPEEIPDASCDRRPGLDLRPPSSALPTGTWAASTVDPWCRGIQLGPMEIPNSRILECWVRCFLMGRGFAFMAVWCHFMPFKWSSSCVRYFNWAAAIANRPVQSGGHDLVKEKRGIPLAPDGLPLRPFGLWSPNGQ